jgi:hypothetical protein
VPPGGHEEGNTAAIVALVLGVIGLLAAVPTVGVLGVILGIVAIVLGVKGRRDVDRGQTRQHRGLATGGLVAGIIATVLGVLILAAVIAGISFLASNSDVQREIDRQEQQQP